MRLIDCDDERLERRYSETQQPHPLVGDRPIMDGIRRERRLLVDPRYRADLPTDISALTDADLKRLLTGYCGLDRRELRVFVTSFAYRHGVPREADLVFDVRFLENPDYVDASRELTGGQRAPPISRRLLILRAFSRRCGASCSRRRIRDQRQDRSDDCLRLRRGPSSFGLCHRTTGGTVARCGAADRACPSRSSAARGGRRRPAGRARRHHRLSGRRPSRGNR